MEYNVLCQVIIGITYTIISTSHSPFPCACICVSQEDVSEYLMGARSIHLYVSSEYLIGDDIGHPIVSYRISMVNIQCHMHCRWIVLTLGNRANDYVKFLPQEGFDKIIRPAPSGAGRTTPSQLGRYPLIILLEYYGSKWLEISSNRKYGFKTLYTVTFRSSAVVCVVCFAMFLKYFDLIF